MEPLGGALTMVPGVFWVGRGGGVLHALVTCFSCTLWQPLRSVLCGDHMFSYAAQEEMYSLVTLADDQSSKGKGVVVLEA